MSRLGWLLYRARWPLGVLVGTLFLTRWLTAPGVQPADSGEFQLVARELGIAHPPGYALYTMAAHGWGRLATWEPVGRLLGADPALWTIDRPLDADPWTWATNAFNALLAVLTLGLVYRTAYLLTGQRIGGVAAAFVLWGVPTFLIQGAIANIRMPTALFTALLIFLTCRWLADEAARLPDEVPRVPDLRLAVLALVAGLAVGHHGSLAFIALACAVVVVARRPSVLRNGRTLAVVFGAIALSLLPQLYLPVRDFQGALFAEGHLRTLAGVVNHVTAADFRGDAFYFHDLNTALDRSAVMWDVIRLSLGLSTLMLAGLGVLWLALHRRWAALLLALVAGSNVFLTLTYRAPQSIEYLMPLYVVAAVLGGVTIGAFFGAYLPRAGPWIVLLIGLALLPQLPELHERRRDQAPQVGHLVSVLNPSTLPANGTILAGWHFAMPFLYAQRHLVDRPDVKVQYVYPEGSETPGTTWLRRLREATGPVLLTNRPNEITDADLPLWPVPGTPFFLNQAPPGGFRLTAPEQPVVFGDRVRLDGFTPTNQRDGTATILVSLSATRPLTEDLAVTAQLVERGNGAVWGQTDVTVPASRWSDPRDVVLQLHVPRFGSETPVAADYQLGVYSTSPTGTVPLTTTTGSTFHIGGFDGEPLGDDLLSKAFPPKPFTSDSIIPFGNTMTLTASSVHRVGNELLVDLTWRADETAARSDYTVSVQAHGEGWQAQDDGTPAMGAIPTLKWLPGQVIHDRHRIQLPADLPADAPFHVTVGVYDAFSLEPLPVTDAERVRQGQGQAAEVWRQGG